MNSRQRRKAEARAHNEARDNSRVLDKDGLLNVEPSWVSPPHNVDKKALLLITMGVMFR
jgi:hypothetical protein